MSSPPENFPPCLQKIIIPPPPFLPEFQKIFPTLNPGWERHYVASVYALNENHGRSDQRVGVYHRTLNEPGGYKMDTYVRTTCFFDLPT